jgi:hypothetical protein
MPALKTLYHLSQTEIGLMVPRVPKSDYEDQTIPRICFSTSIQGCLIGINENKDIQGKRFKVYALETDEYYRPALSEVPDREITGEVWVQHAVEPEYLYDIEITGKSGEHLEELGDTMVMVPQWSYKVVETTLQEDSRSLLVSKSRSVGPYKDQMRGKNRFERKKHSQIAKTVKQYNKIDMNRLFKEDILEVAIPVTGETDSYTVSIRMEGVVAEIARNIKNNKNKLEFKTIVQALTKVFNSANIFVKCTCPDYKYRFAHWNIVNRVSVDDTSKDPGPGKGIRNPNDQLGRGCKHVLLCLANGDWIMKVASVINNYIHYAEEKLQKPFLKLIFPKLYGIPYDEAVDNDLLPEDFELDSSTSIIDTINDYGKNRGKYKPGTNKNPVTGTGGRQKASEPTSKETSPEAKKTSPELAKKEEPKQTEKEPAEEPNKKSKAGGTEEQDKNEKNNNE